MSSDEIQPGQAARRYWSNGHQLADHFFVDMVTCSVKASSLGIIKPLITILGEKLNRTVYTDIKITELNGKTNFELDNINSWKKVRSDEDQMKILKTFICSFANCVLTLQNHLYLIK